MTVQASAATSMPLPVLSPRTSAGAAPAPPAPQRVRAARRLVDSHGRTIRHLRLSITDRCNFRCVYCMEPDVRFMDRRELLSPDEMVRVARVCAGLGVEQVRITGGEPTVHPDLTRIIRGVSRVAPGAIALTTNGALLEPRRLAEWKAAGLGRITVSIDTLSPERFARITRSGASPDAVIEGVLAALRTGFESVKINAVIVRGFNEDEPPALAGLARRLGVDLRFIEYMPLDSGRHWDRSLLVTADEILRCVHEVFPLRGAARDDPSSTAECHGFADGSPGRIGVIAPVSRPFCGACSRLRITADGKVRPCLFSLHEHDLRPALRGGGGDDELVHALIDAIWSKQAGHGISAEGFEQPVRPMSAIGG